MHILDNSLIEVNYSTRKNWKPLSPLIIVLYICIWMLETTSLLNALLTGDTWILTPLNGDAWMLTLLTADAWMLTPLTGDSWILTPLTGEIHGH